MKVLVSGSSGLVGTALTSSLHAAGHEVVRLIRQPTPGAGDGSAEPEVRWDPTTGVVDLEQLAAAGPIHAAVNLAGAGIADRRWTVARRRLIMTSRREPTRLLANILSRLSPRPGVLVSASAVGFYGDRGAQVLTEGQPAGEGFLAEVCRTWEAATAPAADGGIRVVHLRSGIVLSPSGGILGRLLPLYRLGLGGRLGSGRQYVSWISLRDQVAVIRAALEDPRLAGPVNAVAPTPVTNAQLTRAIGRALHRPAPWVVPAVALRVALGAHLADELLLASQRAQPARLLQIGHRFVDPDIDAALTWVAGAR
jgi:hypothetical protein